MVDFIFTIQDNLPPTDVDLNDTKAAIAWLLICTTLLICTDTLTLSLIVQNVISGFMPCLQNTRTPKYCKMVLFSGSATCITFLVQLQRILLKPTPIYWNPRLNYLCNKMTFLS
jgi:hypothetical protein